MMMIMLMNCTANVIFLEEEYDIEDIMETWDPDLAVDESEQPFLGTDGTIEPYTQIRTFNIIRFGKL